MNRINFLEFVIILHIENDGKHWEDEEKHQEEVSVHIVDDST